MRLRLFVLVALVCAGSSCRRYVEARPPKPAAQETVFLLAVAVSPDSALKLARFCLGAVLGDIQLPKASATHTTIATHYSSSRRGGGVRQVAIMALIRSSSNMGAPATLIELGGWALDQAQAPNPRQRAGLPSTALSTNAPALKTPRAVTPRDTTDWYHVQVVLAEFEKAGARRLP
jgi:hypothetical protein